MDNKSAQSFINYFAIKYMADILPPNVLKVIEESNKKLELSQEEADKGLLTQIQSWEQKIAIIYHWDEVIADSNHSVKTTNFGILKRALLENKKIEIVYEGSEKRSQFSLYGLVKRDQQYFIIGSYWNFTDPRLLSVRKIKSVKLTNYASTKPKPSFNLEEFATSYLNFTKNAQIDELEIVFPDSTKSYVQDYKIVCDEDTLSIGVSENGFFKLIAKNVKESKRLEEWLTGFNDKVQVIKPDSLRKIVNKDLVDGLTNLYNRKYFDQLILREVQHYIRNPSHTFSFLLMDIDLFKSINDTLGHTTGDKVLKLVAGEIRGEDAIRYGGEEFSVLLMQPNTTSAFDIAERIRKAIKNNPELKKIRQSGVTISIGIAEFPLHLSLSTQQNLEALTKNNTQQNSQPTLDDAIKEIIDAADIALYKAKGTKDTGRNRSIIYELGMKKP